MEEIQIEKFINDQIDNNFHLFIEQPMDIYTARNIENFLNYKLETIYFRNRETIWKVEIDLLNDQINIVPNNKLNQLYNGNQNDTKRTSLGRINFNPEEDGIYFDFKEEIDISTIDF